MIYVIILIACVWSAGVIILFLNGNYKERDKEWREKTGYYGDMGW